MDNHPIRLNRKVISKLAEEIIEAGYLERKFLFEYSKFNHILFDLSSADQLWKNECALC